MNTIFVWPPAPKAGKPKPGTSGGGASAWPEGLGQSHSCRARRPRAEGLPAAPRILLSLGAPPAPSRALRPWETHLPSSLYWKIKQIEILFKAHGWSERRLRVGVCTVRLQLRALRAVASGRGIWGRPPAQATRREHSPTRPEASMGRSVCTGHLPHLTPALKLPLPPNWSRYHTVPPPSRSPGPRGWQFGGMSSDSFH